MKKTRFKKQELMLFFERLELYISSGLSLNQALSVSTNGVHKKYKGVLLGIFREVDKGKKFAGALGTHIKISKTVLGLIDNGESSGNLAQSILSALALLERQEELKKKCLSAMTYPVVIGVFAIALTLGLVKGVMPQIIPMLKSLHVSLPILTRIVIFFSENIISYGLYYFLSLIFVLILFIYFYKRKKVFRYYFQSFLIKIPLIGNLISMYFLSVFLRSIGSLTESGISVSVAYEDSKETLSFLPLYERLHANTKQIHRGIGMSKIFSSIPSVLMPAYIPPLIEAGEASGNLGKSLLRSAHIIDRSLEHSLKKLTSLIEPIMMAGIGCVVGSIALSIMMPIYDISKVLQK